MSFVDKLKMLVEEDKFYYFGILASISVLIAFIVPQFGYVGAAGEPYSWLNHMVSELGEVQVSEWAIVFNAGLIIGGILYVPFLIGLMKYLDDKMARIGGIIGVIAAICTSLVGCIPMDNIYPHLIVAAGFFMCGIIAVLIFSITILKQGGDKLPRWTGLAGLIALAVDGIMVFTINPAELAATIGIPMDELVSGMLDGTYTLESLLDLLVLNRPEVLSVAVLEWICVLSVVCYLTIAALYFLIMKIKS